MTPEKRPSVISSTSLPSPGPRIPASLIARPGRLVSHVTMANHLGIPLEARVRSTPRELRQATPGPPSGGSQPTPTLPGSPKRSLGD
jgi:hypothetical protein